MKRSVIKLGQSTLVMSLPNRWAEENGIRPKAELDVEEEGDTLHIRATPQRQKRSTTLEFSKQDWNGPKPEKFIERMLATAYKQGADTIIIHCKDKTILDYIEKRTEGFIGLEIVEQKKGSLVLKSVVTEETSFETLLTRAVNLTEHIAAGTYEAFLKRNREEQESLLRLERTHNKVTDYLKRIIAMHRPTWEDKYLYSFVAEDERLVDEYKYLLQLKRLNKNELNLLKRANEFLLLMLDVYRKPTREGIARISSENIPLRSKAQAMLNSKDGRAAMHIHNIIVATYELGETILQWKLRGQLIDGVAQHGLDSRL